MSYSAEIRFSENQNVILTKPVAHIKKHHNSNDSLKPANLFDFDEKKTYYAISNCSKECNSQNHNHELLYKKCYISKLFEVKKSKRPKKPKTIKDLGSLSPSKPSVPTKKGVSKNKLRIDQAHARSASVLKALQVNCNVENVSIQQSSSFNLAKSKISNPKVTLKKVTLTNAPSNANGLARTNSDTENDGDGQSRHNHKEPHLPKTTSSSQSMDNLLLTNNSTNLITCQSVPMVGTQNSQVPLHRSGSNSREQSQSTSKDHDNPGDITYRNSESGQFDKSQKSKESAFTPRNGGKSDSTSRSQPSSRLEDNPATEGRDRSRSRERDESRTPENSPEKHHRQSRSQSRHNSVQSRSRSRESLHSVASGKSHKSHHSGASGRSRVSQSSISTNESRSRSRSRSRNIPPTRNRSASRSSEKSQPRVRGASKEMEPEVNIMEFDPENREDDAAGLERIRRIFLDSNASPYDFKGRGATREFIIASIEYYLLTAAGRREKEIRYNYNSETNKIYLGEGITMSSAKWLMMQNISSEEFIREMAIVIWEKPEILANRALQLSRVSTQLPERSPRKRIEKPYLRLLISLLDDFLDKKKNSSFEDKIASMGSVTLTLSAKIRDCRKAYNDAYEQRRRRERERQTDPAENRTARRRLC